MNFLTRLFLITAVGLIVIVVALQVASGFFLRPVLEREGRRIFRVPVHIEKAGANVLGGSVWMKGVRVKNVDGFSEPDFLSARTVAIDLSLISFLTNEFVIDRILLKDPVFTVEVNPEGAVNLLQFRDNAVYRFQKFVKKKRKLIHLITRYELEKFSIRRGTVQLVDKRQSERDWHWGSISFALARIVYPPDPLEALPVAVYLNAEVQGELEGQELVIGRLNFLSEKKSFDLTGSAKDLVLKEYNHFFSRYPLIFTDGVMQVKVKALAHENQLDVHPQIKIDGLKLGLRELEGNQPLDAFGLPAEIVTHYFNELWPENESFRLDFTVTGDLGSPDFDFGAELRRSIHDSVRGLVTTRMNELVEATKVIADEAIAHSPS